MTFLDTNIFLRFLMPGDQVRAEACRDLFRRLDQGEATAETSEAIVAEVAFVLASDRGEGYRLSHAEIAARMRPLISMRGLHVPNKALMLAAIDAFAEHGFLDFPDASIVARVRHEQGMTVTSYDRDFDRVGDVHRVEAASDRPLAA